MEQCRITKSGVRVYSYKNPASHGFYISFFAKTGSMYESEAESGITHFLEHIAIRNVNAVRGGKLYSELDKYGIDFNASTYSEMVQFYVSGAAENFSVGASVITDLLSPIALPVKDVEAERGRIRAEIRENDEKNSLVSFSGNIVFEGTSLARQIIGNGKSISKITRAKLEAYRRKIMTAENIFFYVTGNFSPADIDALCELIDKHEPKHGEENPNIAPIPEKFGKREPIPHIKNADFTMARLTFDLNMSKLTVPETDIIYDILLSGYNSDFFIEMSEERGLFYDISGCVERYLNIGTLAFSFEIKEAKLYEALEITVDILNKYKQNILPEERLMKAGYVDNAYMLFDDLRELNFTFSYDNHVMKLGYADIEERKLAYKNVTPERLCEVAREIFKPENLTLAIKGKRKNIDADKLSYIIKRLS